MKLSKTTQTQAVACKYGKEVIKRFGFLYNQNPRRASQSIVEGVWLLIDHNRILIDFSLENTIITFRGEFHKDPIGINCTVSVSDNLVPDNQIKWLCGLVIAKYGDEASKLKPKYKAQQKSNLELLKGA